MQAQMGAVQQPFGRRVRDQHLDPAGNALPVGGHFSSSVAVKGPVKKEGRDRTAPEAQAFQFQATVFKIMSLIQQGAGLFWVALKEEVVIASNDHFVAMGKTAEPGVEILDFFGFAPPGKIARMEQDVTRGHAEFAVTTMGI